MKKTNHVDPATSSGTSPTTDGRTDLADFQRVCRYLGVSRSTLLRSIYARKITAIKVGSNWRFRWEDIEKFISRRTMKAA